MTPLEWAGTMIAAIVVLFAAVVALAIWAQARGHRDDHRDTGHWDNSKRQKWCEWLEKEKDK